MLWRVFNQTYKDWELIIVNDCSTDDSLEIANKYAQKDSRIKVFSNDTNQKLPQSLNNGFVRATGEYYTWTSDDNMYKPNAIAFMVEYLDTYKNIDLVSCNLDFINEKGEFENEFVSLVPNRNTLQLVKQCNIGACFMYRKEIALKTGDYDTKMFCAEDYDYWCRIALVGEIAYCDENLYIYRNNSQSLTATKQDIIQKKTYEIRLKYSLSIMNICNLTKKEIIKSLLKNYINSKDERWIEQAQQIDKLQTNLYYFPRKILYQLYSKKKEGNKRIFRVLGFKITVKKNKLTDEYQKLNDKSFYKYNVRHNSVLIVEPNPYHGEILPGFVKYFQDLGFNVDIFLRHENIGDDIFCRYPNKPIIFKGTNKFIKTLLNSKKIKKYEYIFISSSAYWEKDIYRNSYLKYLGTLPKSKNGIILIEHNIDSCLNKYNESKYLKNKRLFTLSGFQNTQILNPHYFGNINITKKNEDKTHFIVVGGIDKCCKNHEILISSIVKLLEQNINNFQVTVIGSGNKIFIPKEIKQFVNFLGFQTFSKIYEELEKADFFLPLLDSEIKEHLRYLNSTTTGSRQLILGFLKPCLINEKFGQAYGFDNKNSILYKRNNLSEAMETAINISNEEYKCMQNNLKTLSNNIYEKSLENLKKTVGIV